MKMVTASDIYDFLNVCAPLEAAMNSDNAGFLVRERETPVSAVLLALDITPDVVGEAVRLGAELITSHHPVVSQPLRCMGPQDVPYPLVQHGIGTICAHTNLDFAPGGVNTRLAEALGLEDIHGVKPYGTSGLWEGLIGNLSCRNSPTEFAEHVKQTLNCGGLEYADGGKSVRTIVLCGGANADLLEDVVQADADAPIMADTKHHQLLSVKRLGITLMDADHLNTKDVVILPLKENLQE